MRPLFAYSTVVVVMAGASVSAQNWPSFRGPLASGVAATGRPPTSWNVTSARNVMWKAPISGDLLIVRTRTELVALRDGGAAPQSSRNRDP